MGWPTPRGRGRIARTAGEPGESEAPADFADVQRRYVTANSSGDHLQEIFHNEQ